MDGVCVHTVGETHDEEPNELSEIIRELIIRMRASYIINIGGPSWGHTKVNISDDPPPQNQCRT